MQPQLPAPRTGTSSPQTNCSPAASRRQAWARELPAPQETGWGPGSLRGASRGSGQGGGERAAFREAPRLFPEGGGRSDGERDETVVAPDVPLEDLGAGPQHALKAGPVQLHALEGPPRHHRGCPGPIQEKRDLPWGRGASGLRASGCPPQGDGAQASRDSPAPAQGLLGPHKLATPPGESPHSPK